MSLVSAIGWRATIERTGSPCVSTRREALDRMLGYRNRDIATTLGSAATTIKKHLTHVFDKVGVDTRSQLIARMA
jgi:DNA-binding NarL/FixJ family response regulator